MGGVCLATWPFEYFFRFLAGCFRICGVQGHQATLTFAFLGTALLAQLESGAAGKALALGAFADGLDVGQLTAFGAELGHRETGESQQEGEQSQQRELIHRATGLNANQGKNDLSLGFSLP